MPVIRVERNKNYTYMSRYHFLDKRLSWKLKGMLSTMLSLPEDWDYSIAGLTTLSNDGDSATRSGLKDLEKYGYLTRTPIRDNGKIIDWEYVVYETPLVENPQMANPQLDNQTQYNNKKDNNKENYTKESQNRNEQPSPTPTFLQNTDDSITPKVRKGTANIVSNEDIEKYFETTYSIYPRKVSKQQAKKTYEHKFRGLESDEARKLAIRIYKSLERQITLWQAENKGNGRELEYIPHFSSWLNDNIEDSKNFKKGR